MHSKKRENEQVPETISLVLKRNIAAQCVISQQIVLTVYKRWLEPSKTSKNAKIGKLNGGGKALSATLAKVLNLKITSLTKCLCNAIEHVPKFAEIRERKTNKDNSGSSS